MIRQSGQVHSSFVRWRRKYSWYLVIFMLATALILVIVGVALIILGKPEHQRTLFKLAKLLGAGGTALGSVQAFWKEIWEKCELVRLQNTSGHAVICGLGDKGMLLTKTIKEKGYRVVVVEARNNHADIAGCKERGVLVLVGDASDKVMLEEANTGRAGLLLTMTGNDNTNIAIAQQALMLTQEVLQEHGSPNLRCYAHITNSSLRDVFARHDLFARSHEGFDASIVNVYETAARVLLEKHPPDFFAMKQGLEGEKLRIVVIGFGKMGENIVKHAARIGHYAEWGKLEIIVLERNARVSAEKFLAAHGDGKIPPSFIVPDVAVRFVDRDPECVVSIAEVVDDDSCVPAVIYLALDDDSTAISLAVRFRNMLRSNATPIVVCIHSLLPDLLDDKSSPFTATHNIRTFSILENACGYQVLMEEVADELARTIHSAYVIAQIPFTQGDFEHGNEMALLSAVQEDIHGELAIHQGNTSLDVLNEQVLSMPDLFDRLKAKSPPVWESSLMKLAQRNAPLRNKSFDELSITERAEILLLNAAILNSVYPEAYPAKKRKNTSVVAWEELDEAMKDANRWPADHLSIKLRTIGFDGSDMTALELASKQPKILADLSEIEHRRWMAERFMDGWRYGPQRDNSRKIHHLLIPYDQLSDEEKQKDKDMILNIRNLVASPGWKKQREFLGSSSDPLAKER